MRVALLTREFPPEVYGGAGVHVAELARHLADHVDLDVHCFGKPRASPLVAGSYEPWGAVADDAALGTLSVDVAMAAKVAGADLVHSHTWYANLGGHLAKLRHDIPHVVTTHSLEPLRPWKREQLGGGYALSRFAERTAIEAADAVITVSAGMRDDVLASYPAVDAVRLHVLYNGIDAEVYTPDYGTGVLRDRGIDPSLPTVVFVGRVTRQKGIVHLLDAAHHLDADAQLVLCAGAADTRELEDEVREHFATLREQRTNIVWIGEMLTREEVVQVLSHATVFVCPSIYEPFGLVNVEAMACEAAVVASAVGGIPEVVVDGETGYVVPFAPGDDPFGSPRDPGGFARDLADRVNELIRHPQRAAAFGRAGRQRVLEHFSWPAIAEQTAALYRRLA